MADLRAGYALQMTRLGLALVPAIFVFLWSTGWVAARYVVPYADPLTFLAVRFACASVLIAAFAALSGVKFPTEPGLLRHALLSGVLLHAIYLGGVWWAVAHGIPAGISALIAALQPLLTALLAPKLLGERMSAIRWVGVVLGFLGLVVALWPKLAGVGPTAGIAIAIPILVNVVAMIAVTAGSFYQKRHLQGGDLRAIAALQYLGALIVTAPAALLLEDLRFEPTLELGLALAWSVIVLSIVTIALYLYLIRRGEVSRVGTLIYLVPPVSAVQAWALLGETLLPIQLVGMAVTVVGVALASRR